MKIILILSSVLCASCANYMTYDIDANKLYNKNERYGIVIFRPMYFETAQSAEEFIQYGSYVNNLSGANLLNVTAYASIPTILTEYSYEAINRRLSIKGKKLDDKFMYKSFSIWDRSSLKPEYFYGVTMLPEGSYYIGFISHFKTHWMGGEVFEKDYAAGENTYYFYVKGGEINYIGDFYMVSPTYVKLNGLFGFFTGSHIYKGSFLIIDRYREAYDFFKNYYSDINLPINKNLMKCCEPMIKVQYKRRYKI